MNTLLLFVYVACLVLAAGYILPLAWFGAGLRAALNSRASRSVTKTLTAGNSSMKGIDDSLRPMVSVVIAARNEETRILSCLESFLDSTYPRDRFEIIVVDDESTDDTRRVAESFSREHETQLRVFVYSPSCTGAAQSGIRGSKKKALSCGIVESRGSIIALTDADCRVPRDWLDLMVGTFDSRTGFVAGPVVFDYNSSAFSRSVALEFMGLAGIHAGSIYAGWPASCSGASIAFRRKAYEEVGGYTGLEQLSSGDDELLMFRIDSSASWTVRYCANEGATVHTRAPESIRSFLQQRRRWASKVGHYENPLVSTLHIAIYLFVLSIPMIMIAALWYGVLWPLVFLMLLAKIGAERLVLSPATRFFDGRSLMWYHIPTQPFQIAYVLWAGMARFSGGFRWKSRILDQ